MPTNIFQDNPKSLPKQDAQIVRVTMKQNEIGARTDHIPTPRQSGDMTISHVPNAGSKT